MNKILFQMYLTEMLRFNANSSRAMRLQYEQAKENFVPSNVQQNHQQLVQQQQYRLQQHQELQQQQLQQQQLLLQQQQPYNRLNSIDDALKTV